MHRLAEEKSEPARFVYGGVEFDVLGGDSRPPQPHFPAGSERFASVVCSLTDAPRPAVRGRVEGEHRRLSVRWNRDSGWVRGRGIKARVRSLGANRFAASATWGPHALSEDPLVDALAPLLVERCGGLVLHAATSEIDGEAVAFVGPSGAGKSTAVALANRPVFSRDKLIVVRPPGRDGWWCWPLAQGSGPDGVPASTHSALPLAAVVRVSASSDGTVRCDRVGAADAIFLLRESTVPLEETADAEHGRLEVIAALAAGVPVRRLHTVLGAPILPELQRSLADA